MRTLLDPAKGSLTTCCCSNHNHSCLQHVNNHEPTLLTNSRRSSSTTRALGLKAASGAANQFPDTFRNHGLFEVCQTQNRVYKREGRDLNPALCWSLKNPSVGALGRREPEPRLLRYCYSRLHGWSRWLLTLERQAECSAHGCFGQSKTPKKLGVLSGCNSPFGYRFFESGLRTRVLKLVRQQSLIRLSTSERLPNSDGEFGKRRSFLVPPFFYRIASKCLQHLGAVSFLRPTIGGKERLNPTGAKYTEFPQKEPTSPYTFFRDCSRIKNKVQDYLIPSYRGDLATCQKLMPYWAALLWPLCFHWYLRPLVLQE